MNDWDDIKSLDEELILVQLRKREKELPKKIKKVTPFLHIQVSIIHIYFSNYVIKGPTKK